MRRLRPEILLLLLPLVAVGVLAALAWRDAGDAMESALARRGEALLGLARAAVDASRYDVQRVEQAETRRLNAIIDRIDTELTHLRAPVSDLLPRMAAEGEVGRIFLVGKSGGALARVVHPPPIERPGIDPAVGMAAQEWRNVRKSLEALGAEAGSTLIEGIRPNAFKLRDRLGVARRLADGSALLVRADQAALERARAQRGVEGVLERLARVPDVARVGLQLPDGAVIALAGEASEEVRVERFEEPIAAPSGDRLTVHLSRARLEASVAERRREILIGAGLAALAVLIGLLIYMRMARARRLAEQREQERERSRALERESDRRLAEMGALAGLFAHEVSNPLNAIALETGRLGMRADDDTREGIGRMQERLAVVRETLESYLQVARSAGVEAGGRYEASSLRETATELGAHFACDAGAPQALSVDPRTFDLALRNLVRNALTARTDAAAHLAWRREDAGGVCITVEDDGPGYPEEILAVQGRVGHALRSGGHGLGLALTRRFLENAGCRLSLGRSEAHGGACATVHVPASRVLGEEGASDV